MSGKMSKLQILFTEQLTALRSILASPSSHWLRLGLIRLHAPCSRNAVQRPKHGRNEGNYRGEAPAWSWTNRVYSPPREIRSGAILIAFCNPTSPGPQSRCARTWSFYGHVAAGGYEITVFVRKLYGDSGSYSVFHLSFWHNMFEYYLDFHRPK